MNLNNLKKIVTFSAVIGTASLSSCSLERNLHNDAVQAETHRHFQNPTTLAYNNNRIIGNAIRFNPEESRLLRDLYANGHDSTRAFAQEVITHIVTVEGYKQGLSIQDAITAASTKFLPKIQDKAMKIGDFESKQELFEIKKTIKIFSEAAQRTEKEDKAAYRSLMQHWSIEF